MKSVRKNIILGILGITLVVSSFSPFISYTFAQDGTGEGTVLSEDQNGQGQNLPQTGIGFQPTTQALPACSMIPGKDGSFEGCIVRGVYYLVLYPSAWLAGLAGQVFDFFVAFTLNSDSYRSGGFIEKGWRIIRDVANVSLIFILVYLAFRLMFGLGGDIARSISRVILVALIINFSLFATRVIVDAGNIVGRAFYSRIIVSDSYESDETGFKPLSVGVLDQVNPQALLSEKIFQKKFGGSSQEQVIQNNNLGDVGTSEAVTEEGIGSGYLILIMLIAAAVNLFIGFAFLNVAIFLIARTVGLWLLMIVSPIAFASLGIPGLSKAGGGKLPLDFSSWLNQSFSLSFMVVVFMFFLYLIVMFLQDVFGDMVSRLQNENASTLHFIMSVVIPVAIVFTLLNIAKSQAKNMAGFFGEMVSKGLKTAAVFGLGAAGLGLGAAAGVGGVLGRQVLGRVGGAMAKNANTATAGGRFRKKVGTWASKSSWDARNVKVPQPVGKALGWGRSGLSYATGGAMGAGDFALNTGKGTQKGGYAQRREAYAKEKIDKSKEFIVDDKAVVETNPTSYTHVDTNGKKSTRTIASTNTSVSQAQAQVEERQRILDQEKERVHRDNDYERKKQELADKQKEYEKEVEQQKKELDAKEKKYKEMVAEKQAGNTSITDTDIDNARTARDKQQATYDTKVKDKKDEVDTLKKSVEDIEVLYRKQENELEQAKAILASATRALSNKNAEILNNYAESIENWALVPDLGTTHRFDANRDAAAEVRNAANRQRK